MRKEVKEYLLDNFSGLSFDQMDRISHELVKLARYHFQ
ncbi:MAG: hypothetical protein MAG715_00486 [Methanonatronarchaeales archaeon]|nr:hypothetical protein [Methanonatronarchaeales archaeon]